MGKIINPKTFLLTMRSKGSSVTVLSPSDQLELPELNITVPLELALDHQAFYAHMKKAVSGYNAEASLNGKSPLDFDDLHTRYGEYIEALIQYL